MAQTLRLCWPRWQDSSSLVVAEVRDLAAPPKFISGTSRSAIFVAVEAAAPELAISNLSSLAQNAGLVVLFVGSDLASGCSRAKLELAS
eukprot:1831897-Alexandrium_andersonii.AAC.1